MARRERKTAAAAVLVLMPHVGARGMPASTHLVHKIINRDPPWILDACRAEVLQAVDNSDEAAARDPGGSG